MYAQQKSVLLFGWLVGWLVGWFLGGGLLLLSLLLVSLYYVCVTFGIDGQKDDFPIVLNTGKLVGRAPGS